MDVLGAGVRSVGVLVLTPTGLSQLLDDIPGLAKHLLQEVVDPLVATTDNHSP
jgi:hypothetical protein